MSAPTGDEVLVRNAARRIAAQTTGLVAIVVLLLATIVSVLVVRGQSRATDDLLRGTIETADDVGDPPAGSWIVIVRNGTRKQTPGLPLPLAAVLVPLRETAGSSVGFANLISGRFRAATAQREGAVVQVVTSLDQQREQRERLVKAMLVAALLGLVAAALIGILVGRRAVRPLAQALLLQRAFVSDASHELRTPLTLLSTRAQLHDRAVQAGALTEQTRADSSGVVQDVQRLGEVVKDLLVAADPRGEAEHVPVPLAPLVEEVVAAARAHAADSGVSVTTDLEPLAVQGSRPALRRALLSLVDNAIDHTPVGGAVTVRLAARGKNAVVAVSDTGPGVRPQDAPHVLRRFHSGGQRSGRTHYGLGLALSNDVANRHGGHLRLAESDVGATFELAIPAISDATKNGGSS